MIFRIVCLFLFGLVSTNFAQTPSGEYILKKIDQNIVSENKVLVSRMIIHSRRGSRTIQSKSWISGTEKSFTEYLAPAREKGTKMLKLTDHLWTYSPGSDRIIKISGHLLRQSVMGSDMSYEDMMEDPRLINQYQAEVIGEEIIDLRQCWVVQLTATQQDVAYYSRKIWVDKERFIALKEARFGKSGKQLKSTHITEVMKISNRWFPKRMVFKDELKRGDGTEFIIDSIQFNVKIPNHIFTKAVLRK